jgi:voltage-gated potassium channel Kch
MDHAYDQSLEVKNLITSTVVLDDQSSEVTAFSQYVYFSFVTMSTLGYGDITPRSSIAQTLAWMQSVTGQFYIAVLVAWMVSEIPRRRSSE